MRHKTFRAFLLFSLFCFCFNSSAKEIILPDIGASSSLALSASMEEKIARSVIQQLRESHGLVEDMELKQYLEKLGYSIVEQTEDSLQPFHFFLVNSNQVNAFATPGGVIAVYTGLFAETETESELASVISHEIAHVTQHHIARAYEKVNQMNIPMTLGVIAALLLGAAGGGDAGIAAATGLSAMGAQTQIDTIRANEREADRVGMRYLSKAKFNPYGMPEFFQKLQRKNRYTDKSYPEFLRTHPVTTDRIAESMDRARDFSQQQKNLRSETTYRMMKAKLKIISGSNSKKLVDYYRSLSTPETLKTHPEYHYGYGLALLKNHQTQAAIDKLHQLHQYSEDNFFFINALAQAYLKSQQPKHHIQALRLLEQALSKKTFDVPLSANYAQALIQTGNYQKSIDFIQQYHQNNFPLAEFYQLLAIAYGKKGERLSAHTAKAEYFYLTGQYEPALGQLRSAKRLAQNDFYTLSKLDAKIQEVLSDKDKYQMDNPR